MKKPVITASLTREEKEKLCGMAKEWDVKPCVIVRRLISFLNRERIKVDDLLKSCYELASNTENKHTYDLRIRAHLEHEERENLETLAQLWDIPASGLLQRLLCLFIAGKIGKQDIWF